MAQSITTQIVNLTAQVTTAPTPSQLQQSGALVSVGGTTLTTNSYQYCGDLSQVQSFLQTSGTGNYAELLDMATTFFAQGAGVGLYLLELGYNAAIPDQITSLQTWITNNPGVFYAYLTPVNWDSESEVVKSVTITNGGSGYTVAPSVTFTAAASGGVTATGTAVIDGSGTVTGITITNPGWYPNQSSPTVTIAAPSSGTTAAGTVVMGNAQQIAAANYESPTGKTYFFVTTSTANMAQYAATKSVFALVPSPTAAASEFQCAVPFYQWLVNNPKAATPLAPMAFRYAYGVTPWAAKNNQPTLTNILTNYSNVIYTGAEGGISNAILFKGMLQDGTQASWWYGIDWFQIQVKQALAAAIINGSNSNPPLVYNQNGINTLQKIAQNVANSAVIFGCALSATVSATSFADYTTQNPNDYQAGIYDGLSATVVGQNGFQSITFALDAVQFVV